ncbi:MAG: hypothetical protein U9N85_09310 [Bacteroidota bacterium]|nr:hypothetical protein [Bacteroidota bacterium]
MKFELKLNVENPEEEISYLNDFIKEHDIAGLETEIPEQKAKDGSMDGALLVNALNLLVAGTIGEIIKQVFSVIGKHFDGRRADIELKYTCPNNGMEFKEKYTFTTEKKREEIYADFKKTIEKNCKKTLTLLKA